MDRISCPPLEQNHESILLSLLFSELVDQFRTAGDVLVPEVLLDLAEGVCLEDWSSSASVVWAASECDETLPRGALAGYATGCSVTRCCVSGSELPTWSAGVAFESMGGRIEALAAGDLVVGAC